MRKEKKARKQIAGWKTDGRGESKVNYMRTWKMQIKHAKQNKDQANSEQRTTNNLSGNDIKHLAERISELMISQWSMLAPMDAQMLRCSDAAVWNGPKWLRFPSLLVIMYAKQSHNKLTTWKEPQINK